MIDDENILKVIYMGISPKGYFAQVEIKYIIFRLLTLSIKDNLIFLMEHVWKAESWVACIVNCHLNTANKTKDL